MRPRQSLVPSRASLKYGRRLEVLPAQQTIGDDQTERRDLRLHLGDVLAASFLVGAALQAPLEIALGARRSGLAEHVQADAIPLRDRGLRLVFPRGAAIDELLELLLAVCDVALLLAQDDLQGVVDRGERRADHLLELILTDLFVEEAVRGEVGPRRHVLLEI